MNNTGKQEIKRELFDEAYKKLIDLCWPTRDVLKWLVEEKGYDQTYAYRLLAELKDDIKANSLEIRKSHLEKTITRLETDIKELKNGKDKKMLLEYTKELNKLLGAYAPEEVNVNITSIKAKFGDYEEDDSTDKSSQEPEGNS